VRGVRELGEEMGEKMSEKMSEGGERCESKMRRPSISLRQSI